MLARWKCKFFGTREKERNQVGTCRKSKLFQWSCIIAFDIDSSQNRYVKAFLFFSRKFQVARRNFFEARNIFPRWKEYFSLQSSGIVMRDDMHNCALCNSFCVFLCSFPSAPFIKPLSKFFLSVIASLTATSLATEPAQVEYYRAITVKSITVDNTHWWLFKKRLGLKRKVFILIVDGCFSFSKMILYQVAGRKEKILFFYRKV